MTMVQFFQSFPDQTGGADNIPIGLYMFFKEESFRFLLLGATYNADGLAIANKPSKLNSGEVEDVFILINHNQTGVDYRLSYLAFREAVAKYPQMKEFYDIIELSQKVEEKPNGQLRVTVTLH